ncbi:uncharacterized protein LOC124124600 isoform X2 [Haliotis rufescens]|uniref:uncharacterized protein LOC124124600 isoform X2 n=1 Tax=Haliotis rufescens TaxID=6454 RepID=UPI00201EA995|nr:uncharacterized protein LOC124124600 isoform X2 [Haliotis rufescens]
MKSLVLLMLVFGTVAADAEETSLLDMKESLQTKIKEAVPTDDFVKVLLDIDVEDILKVLEQVPLEDRKKLCELMPARRMAEYFERLPVEDREKVGSCQGDLIRYEDRPGQVDKFLQTLTGKERVELYDYFNKTSILQRFLGKHPEEIKKTLFAQKKKFKPFDDLLQLPLDQQLEMWKGFTLKELRNVFKVTACPLRDDFDIGRMINNMLIAFGKEDNDNIKGTEDEDLEKSQGSAYTHWNRADAPGDEEGNGYEEPFFKQIIEIQLGQSKGIKVEQTPEIQK